MTSVLPDLDNSTAVSGLPLRDIKQSGAPVEERLARPADGRTFATTLIEGNKWRSEFFSMAKGQLEGNPPYDQERLNAKGQQWRANINPMDTKARVSAALTPYYDLFAGGKYYAWVELDEEDPDKRKEWSEIVSQEFDQLPRQWKAFDGRIQAAIFERLYFGLGFLAWPDEDDQWRPDWIPQHRVLVPDGTECDPDRVDGIVIRQRLTVSQLWRVIRDRDTAAARGWDVDAVARAIRCANPDTVNQNTITGDNYVEVQQWLKDRDCVESARCKRVMVAHLYIPEMDGKVSHYLITEQPCIDEPAQGVWLYRKVRQYDSMRQAVCPFFYEIMENSWHGSNGMAREIYQTMLADNRIVCALLDGAFLRSGISLQAMSERSRQNTALVQVGAFNIIPPGYQVHQAQIMGDLDGSIATADFLDRRISSNTGTYRQRAEVEKPEGNPVTATEARLDFQNSAVLGNSAVNRFNADLDRMWSETYRRASLPGTTDKEAKEFQRRCIKRGVPEKSLAKVARVTAFRALGNGSMFLGQEAIRNSMSLVSMLPEEGRQNWVDDAIGVVASERQVRRWNPRAEPEKNIARDRWDAKMENAAIKVGAPVEWTALQNNTIHADEHLTAGAEAAASLQKGARPIDVSAFIEGIVEHTARHIQKLGTDPAHKAEDKKHKADWEHLKAISDKLQARVMQDMQAQQQQQQAAAKAQSIAAGTDPNVQIKAASEAQKSNLRRRKADSDLAIKQRRAQQDMAIKDAQAAQAIRNKPTT